MKYVCLSEFTCGLHVAFVKFRPGQLQPSNFTIPWTLPRIETSRALTQRARESEQGLLFVRVQTSCNVTFPSIQSETLSTNQDPSTS